MGLWGDIPVPFKSATEMLLYYAVLGVLNFVAAFIVGLYITMFFFRFWRPRPEAIEMYEWPSTWYMVFGIAISAAICIPLASFLRHRQSIKEWSEKQRLRTLPESEAAQEIFADSSGDTETWYGQDR